jgi:hypothetical protein
MTRNGHRNGGPLIADLDTTMSWHPRDQADVEQALLMAMDAMDARAATAQEILEDPYLAGLIDPDRLIAQMVGDHRATTVLRALLARPVAETA